MKSYIYIALLLVVFIVGFFLGKGQRETEVKTEYIKGETVFRTVKVPYPSTVYIPTAYRLPTKKDTLYVNGEPLPIQTVDTARIIQEYIAENTYEFNAFDEEFGKLDIKQTLQYNQLKTFDYSFTPIYKHTTVTKKNLFEPFGSAGINTFNQVSVGGGVFINNLGLEYSYIYDTKMMLTGHGLSVKLKF